MDENILCETELPSGACDEQSGVVYTNEHRVNVLNGENPSTFDFKIKMLVHGGNEVWFPSSIFYRLNTKCPTSSDIIANGAYSTHMQTYLGATGADSVYSFT